MEKDKGEKVGKQLLGSDGALPRLAAFLTWGYTRGPVRFVELHALKADGWFWLDGGAPTAEKKFKK